MVQNKHISAHKPLQKYAILFCGRQKEVKHFFLCPTALVLFNSSLWTHYPRCKYTLDNCSSVLKDHIERLLARCPRVFLPPTAFLSLLGRPISDALNRFCAWCALRVGWVSICLSMHRKCEVWCNLFNVYLLCT